MVKLDDNLLKGEIYDQLDEIYNLRLDWKDEFEVEVVEDIQLHQNRPNPWNEETVIPFEIPGAGEVSLNITNAIGEEVSQITREFTAGKQQFKIINESWAPGLYYYTIRFGDTQLTKTMLILSKH
jgi:hypothetical protein